MEENEAPLEAPNEAEAPEVVEAPPPKKNPMVRNVILGVVVLVAAIYGFRVWSFNQGHIRTDDAYITTDVVPVTSKDPGNVLNVFVNDNQEVQKGDLLVQLDDTNLLTDLHQAEANLAMAKAQAQGSHVDVGMTSTTANAQVDQARGALAQSQADIDAARAGVSKARANVASMKAATSVAESQVRVALDAVEARKAALKQATAQVSAAQAQVTNTEAAIRSAQADVTAAESAADYANREAQRARSLANEGALSLSAAEAKETEATHARAVVETARQKVQSAQAMADQARSQLTAARAAVTQAQVAIAQANSEVQAARQGVAQSRALAQESNTGVLASEEAVSAAQARAQQAQGKLKESNVVPEKVAAMQSTQNTADARVKQAEAALEKAKLAVARTHILAPASGVVSRRNVQVGQQVATGQPLLAILPKQTPWVVANLKETQLSQVRPGMEAEIEVDALPGRTFRGKVESVSGGTGATFALLPPDNATGNFTKVVQRVPVKIVLDAGQPHLEELRSGLSSIVTITLK